MRDRTQYAIRSVGTLFRIIQALKEMDGAKASELADRLDIPESTLHNYLSTLVQEGYIVKDGTSYGIGIRFLEYGTYAKRQINLYNVAKSKIDALARSTGELASLMIEEDGQGTYLYRVEGANAISPACVDGTRLPLVTTALGRSILAHLPQESVDNVADKRAAVAGADAVPTTYDDLTRELAGIRERGVAFDDETERAGLRCVAAPILDEDDQVLGAVGVSGPSYRIQNERFARELPREVLDKANEVRLDVVSI
ncbi:IclR family transcriptional regulator [Halococcus sp. IIIV-5B]|uniref:IclR family transcriptional regulator n=1 Tax=Halococcus sp. IIIV-5B TaxID=2321230 RepID=UPI000E752312|nr:IclR family transcriptional regulator [Halococcus sp. IIIV-5B]RJT01456.1 IclR family transcriptional regulator [Halococcus sp. IIIV-5B]